MKRKTTYRTVPSKAPVVEDSAGTLDESREAMVRTQIYLSRGEHEFLQSEADRMGKPMAAIIREFIDQKMELPTDVWTNNPMLRPTPTDPDFNSPPDGAINHDHYLHGTPKKWIKVKGQWVEAPPLPEDYYENAASYENYNRNLEAMNESR